MKEAIKKITASQLFKVSLLNALSVLVKVAGGILSTYVVAAFLGPARLALVGNFRNFLSPIESLSTLGMQNGIIKYVAQYHDDEDKLAGVLNTVLVAILVTVAVISIGLFGLSSLLSAWVFNGDMQYQWIFIVLAFALPCYTGNFILAAVLNGLSKYKDVVRVNIWGNVLGVLFSAILIWKMQTDGALLGLIFSPLFMFIFSSYLLGRHFRGKRFFRLQTDMAVLKSLLSYSYMSLIAAIAGPVILLTLRNMLIDNYGAEEAGFWEAMNRLSSFYMLFVSTLLTVYFLPELSKSQSIEQTKIIFLSYYKSIVPLFTFGLVVLYFMRHFVIKLFLTEEFLPMENLFLWQLLGDFFKTCAYILAFEFFAKKLVRTFIVTELFSFVILYVSGYFLIENYGSEGAVMAHAVTYAAYFSVMLVYFRKKLF